MNKFFRLSATLAITFMLSLNANANAQIVDPSMVDGESYSNNTGANKGGVIYNSIENTLTIKDSTFTKNNAVTAGGAVFNEGDILIKNSNFTENYGTHNNTHGGAFFNKGVANIIDSTFTGNSACIGGAIANQSVLNITSSKFINNKLDHQNDAWASAAAINNNDGTASIMNLDNVYFEGNNNTSLGGGGAIYFGTTSSVQSTIKNSDFYKNKAHYNKYSTTGKLGEGGAIGFGIGDLLIENTTFRENSAERGGAISIYAPYASDDFNGGRLLTLKEVDFTGNYSTEDGGAMFSAYNAWDTTKVDIQGGSFTNNSAGKSGGAIYAQDELITEGTSFIKNTAQENGGALYIQDKASITSSTFNNNNATSMGGAVYVKQERDGSLVNEVAEFTNTTFDSNNSDYAGGAIMLHRGEVTINGNSSFVNNTALYGGAIYTASSKNTLNVIGSEEQRILFQNNTANGTGAVGIYSQGNISYADFIGNKATDSSEGGGGAISIGAAGKAYIDNVNFENNTSASLGGAIATRDITLGSNLEAKLDILNSTFKNNKSYGNGGAIYNAFYNSNNSEGSAYIYNTIFENNESTNGNGGAIYNAAKDLSNTTPALTIKDTSFINNKASQFGGAIFSKGEVTISAEKQDVIFEGNTAQSGADIYMDGGSDSTLALNAAENKKIVLNGSVSGSENYRIIINSTTATSSYSGSPISYTGDVILNSIIENAEIEVADGSLHLEENFDISNSKINMGDDTTLNTINGKLDDYGSSITFGDNVNLLLDVDVNGNSSDALNLEDTNVTIKDINPVGVESSDSSTSINLAKLLNIDPKRLTVDEKLTQGEKTIITPIRYMKGTINSTGTVTYAPKGNGYGDFNPAVMASSVAAQVGGYLSQLNSYEQAFRNMDTYMLMTKEERQALKYKNKYATISNAITYNDEIINIHENGNAWISPFTTFEQVDLKGGPDVSNVSYGSYFGVDSNIKDLGHGYEGIYSVYAGYTGSHQSYDHNSIYQNGGTLGLSAMIFKDNFFTGLTINTGANAGRATTMYGSEDFNMLMSGIASKTGVNYEFLDGKLIIQPNYTMSYSFVNTFDYTNAAGVKINSNPLHAIHLEPGIKIIGNLKGSLQPYAGVSVIWNLLDSTNFKANNTALPELSVKPYVKYGVGVQKRVGERCTGYFQTYITHGGRQGVGLSAGLNIMLGRKPKP